MGHLRFRMSAQLGVELHVSNSLPLRRSRLLKYVADAPCDDLLDGMLTLISIHFKRLKAPYTL